MSNPPFSSILELELRRHSLAAKARIAGTFHGWYDRRPQCSGRSGSQGRNRIHLCRGHIQFFQSGNPESATPNQYTNWLQGIGGYFDFNYTDMIGAEAEIRLLRFNQMNSVHEDTYTIGPKITYRIKKYEPYGKVLFGVGEINFPYSFAHGGYFAMSFGGGLDYRVTPRLKIRAIDYEYQYWPGFLNHSLQPYGFSVGASYRIFK